MIPISKAKNRELKNLDSFENKIGKKTAFVSIR